ncbi:hypothetical protein LPJ72_005278 [Coemansia sp. Benny D160-2]|nr:hypothetical protein LPJ72_005278 [Coemansia sp. Benny D160-2]
MDSSSSSVRTRPKRKHEEDTYYLPNSAAFDKFDKQRQGQRHSQVIAVEDPRLATAGDNGRCYGGGLAGFGDGLVLEQQRQQPPASRRRISGTAEQQDDALDLSFQQGRGKKRAAAADGDGSGESEAMEGILMNDAAGGSSRKSRRTNKQQPHEQEQPSIPVSTDDWIIAEPTPTAIQETLDTSISEKNSFGSQAMAPETQADDISDENDASIRDGSEVDPTRFTVIDIPLSIRAQPFLRSSQKQKEHDGTSSSSGGGALVLYTPPNILPTEQQDEAADDTTASPRSSSMDVDQV